MLNEWDEVPMEKVMKVDMVAVMMIRAVFEALRDGVEFVLLDTSKAEPKELELS